MSLIDSMMERCLLMNKVRSADGEGGFVTTLTNGPEIRAAITLDTTMLARVAEQQGVSSTYTVTTSKANSLEFGDVIKRVKDGQTFRITSNAEDKQSPAVSTLDIAQVKAEKWELTT